MNPPYLCMVWQVPCALGRQLDFLYACCNGVLQHESVDVCDIFFLEFDESAQGAVSFVAVGCGVGQVGDVLLLAAQFAQSLGHTDGLEEVAEGLDTGFGGALGMLEIHGTAPNAVGELGKAHHIMLHGIFHPGREDNGQAGTVGAIVEGRQLVLDIVACPVLSPILKTNWQKFAIKRLVLCFSSST